MTKDEEKRSVDAVKREDFLTIVKSSDNAPGLVDDSEQPNIGRDGVQFKNNFELKTAAQPNKKPLITEISMSESTTLSKKQQEEAVKKQVESEIKFDWETATRVELKPTYLA